MEKCMKKIIPIILFRYLFKKESFLKPRDTEDNLFLLFDNENLHLIYCQASFPIKVCCIQ